MTSFNILIHRIAYPTLLIFFFLPFISVQCTTGQKISELNGFQLAKGGSYGNKLSNINDLANEFSKFDNNKKKSFEDVQKEIKVQNQLRKIMDLSPNPFLLIFLIVLVISLIFSILITEKVKMQHFLVGSIIELICLISFFILLQSFETDQLSKLTEMNLSAFLDVNPGYGFYFCLALVFALFVFQLSVFSDSYYDSKKAILEDID